MDTAKTEKITYTCPMHSEVKSGQPGSCPKCGMELVSAKDTQDKPKGCECCN